VPPLLACAAHRQSTAEPLQRHRPEGRFGWFIRVHSGFATSLVHSLVRCDQGHKRHPLGDRSGGLDAPDRLRAVPVLPEEHELAVGGPDGEQVKKTACAANTSERKARARRTNVVAPNGPCVSFESIVDSAK
jgi:hypothetical protein